MPFLRTLWKLQLDSFEICCRQKIPRVSIRMVGVAKGDFLSLKSARARLTGSVETSLTADQIDPWNSIPKPAGRAAVPTAPRA